MKQLIRTFAFKLIAFLLMLCLSVTSLLSGLAVILAINYGLYSAQTLDELRFQVLEDITYDQLNTIDLQLTDMVQANYDENRRHLLNYYRDVWSRENSNLSFSIYDSAGNLIFDNYKNENSVYSVTSEIGFYTDEGWQGFIVTADVQADLTANDRYAAILPVLRQLYSFRYQLLWILGGEAAVLLLLFVLLMCGAGRRRGRDDIVLWYTDRIPLELFLGTMVFLGALVVAVLQEILHHMRYSDWDMFSLQNLTLFSVLLTVAIVPLVMYVLTTLARQIKKGKWWRNSLIWYLFAFCRKVFCKLKGSFSYLIKNLPLYWKAGIIWCGVCFYELILQICAFNSYDPAFALWVIEKIALTAAVAYTLIGLRKLQKGGEEMAAGNFSYITDITRMPPSLQQHGENLNRINEGLQLAVEERMKSERLKTELITNVSHDIKTPITSIVNYVDLLQKEELQNEKAAEYLEVLNRQSQKLKKLTEDLVEVSKASAGSISVNMEAVDINVLLMQASAEFEERFANKELECILSAPETPVMVSADGRLMWRVFDNLMGNIAKYALEGTRVYLSVEELGEKVTVTVKNISKYPLNISSDELMERFVRGDSSRHTEGSGLGLSIAQNLMRLQKGSLDLTIDGDLFKAAVTLEKSASV